MCTVLSSKLHAVCACHEQHTSVHISFTFSRIMLQCLSKAFTRPSSLWLLRQLISTCSTAPTHRGRAHIHTLSATLQGAALH